MSVYLAQQAVKECGKSGVKIAASVPPLSESYRADLVPSDDVLRKEYEELIPALGEADIYLCETMSSIRESDVAVPICTATGKTTWASFTLERN